MIKGLKRLAGGGLLLLELRGLRAEVARLATAQERLTEVMAAFFDRQYPTQVQPDPSIPSVEISYVNVEHQRILMEVELRLTQARGQPPTEDEILAEFDRMTTPLASGPEG